MKAGYRFVKDYKEDVSLRKSLSDLAERAFGIQLENWYQTGYWKDKYIPYSIVADEKVVANVSVNLMDFIENGNVKHLVQLGTVITDKKYERQGLSRYLIEAILEDYSNKVEGIYLFANDTVLDFYPKFGFSKSKEYQYLRIVKNSCRETAILRPMNDRSDWKLLEQAIKDRVYLGAFEMENLDLSMFYATSILRNNVYYLEETDTYVLADVKGSTLRLYSILSKQYISEDVVIESFGDKITKVIFEYTPINVAACEKNERKEEDTTLFVMGEGLVGFEQEEKMFPAISHA